MNQNLDDLTDNELHKRYKDIVDSPITEDGDAYRLTLVVDELWRRYNYMLEHQYDEI